MASKLGIRMLGGGKRTFNRTVLGVSEWRVGSEHFEKIAW